MAISSYELVQVATEYVTADLICWKRYKQKCPGMVEALLIKIRNWRMCIRLRHSFQ